MLDIITKKPAGLAAFIVQIIVTSIFSFIIAALFHSAYDFLGRNHIDAFIFPVNESVWEHLKLCFYPLVLVWLMILKRQYTIHELAAGISFSSLTCIVTVLFGYYGFHYGFLAEGLIIDLLLLLIGNLLGNSIAFYLLKDHTFYNFRFIFALYLIGLAILFVYTTLRPPDLPVFISS